jgi:hypothetical protein
MSLRKILAKVGDPTDTRNSYGSICSETGRLIDLFHMKAVVEHRDIPKKVVLHR